MARTTPTNSASFHSASGGPDFLGLRQSARGETQIVFDDGVTRRMVWRVTRADEDVARLHDVLLSAVNAPRVLPALYAELKRRAIAVEIVGG